MSVDPVGSSEVAVSPAAVIERAAKSTLAEKACGYWTLTKSRQTLLLLAAGIAGYLSARPADLSIATLGGMAAALFLAVSGTTVLNMVADRDIDARMGRTAGRPLPAGLIKLRAALAFGISLVVVGLAVAVKLSPLFAALIAAGAFFDLVVYTVWLKRRSPSSIIFGGVSGAVPMLAGRALAIGHVDGLGILLALSVLLWIPTHIMPLWIRYADEYRGAGIPTWPQAYGLPATRWFIALSNAWTAGCLILAGHLLGIGSPGIALLGLSSAAMTGVSFWVVRRPSDRLNYLIFKLASIYMLTSLMLITLGAIL